MSEESISEDPKQCGAKLSLDLQHQPHSMEVASHFYGGPS